MNIEERLDHIEKMLAELIRIVGNTNTMVAQLNARLDESNKEQKERFDSFSREQEARFDAFSREQEARFDTFSKEQETRFDAFSREQNTKMDGFKKELTEKIDRLAAKVDNLEVKVDKLEVKVDRNQAMLLEKHDELDTGLSYVYKMIGRYESMFVEQKQARFQAKMEQLDKKNQGAG